MKSLIKLALCLSLPVSMTIRQKLLLTVIALISLSFVAPCWAETREVDLHINYKTANFAGLNRPSLMINQQIPAPTLHFKEGDEVKINVYNHLDQTTALHWHGIILPWQMDGVAGITQEGIPPGGVFHYRFKLRQSGTYWYHAHKNLQEQEGMYGAFIIDPARKPKYHYDKDHVIVLSDWSNTPADQIEANLKKTGEYYSPRFPLQSSLLKFLHDYKKASPKERKMLLDDYKMMQQMRMGLYDFADVAYDAFLLNGQTVSHPWTAKVNPGDVVRLRFIGAGGSTIFRVKIPGNKMRVVHVQGNDVQPISFDDFMIAPGETVDVLVKIQNHSPTIIYAESISTLGSAVGALVTNSHQLVNFKAVKPFSEPLPVSRPMMSLMMEGMGHMNHDMNMEMPTEPSVIGDSISKGTKKYHTSKGIQYRALTAAVKTNNPEKPVDATINMELFGYMERYIWFINGVPSNRAKPIIFKPGKRYRFVFTNTSMMRHPMHLHGHWFILRQGKGAYDPLLHTINVAPGATITADVDTDASGQWFFHCHLLYHMVSGMARIFQYSTLLEMSSKDVAPQNTIQLTPYHNRPIVRVDDLKTLNPHLVEHPMGHSSKFSFANWLDAGLDFSHNIQKLTFKGMYGYDYNKVALFINDAEINKGKIDEADMDIVYWHLLDQFWAAKAGMNMVYRPRGSTYWQPAIGLEGLMPYFIETDMRAYYHRGSVKLDLELGRDTQITNNFFIHAAVRGILASKTVKSDEVGSGLNQMRYMIKPYYRLTPALNAFFEYEHEQAHGVYKSLKTKDGESPTQDTFTLGFSLLF